jgi:hypothetical protein
VDDVLEPDDGVVDGSVEGAASVPPLSGQSPVAGVAAFESATTATGVDAGVDSAAEPDELVAACATAPPASAAVAASVTTILRERGNMYVHLLSWCPRR